MIVNPLPPTKTKVKADESMQSAAPMPSEPLNFWSQAPTPAFTNAHYEPTNGWCQPCGAGSGNECFFPKTLSREQYWDMVDSNFSATRSAANSGKDGEDATENKDEPVDGDIHDACGEACPFLDESATGAPQNRNCTYGGACGYTWSGTDGVCVGPTPAITPGMWADGSAFASRVACEAAFPGGDPVPLSDRPWPRCADVPDQYSIDPRFPACKSGCYYTSEDACNQSCGHTW